MSENTRIRTELPAQTVQLQQIANIQTLLLHLEAKGKAPNTIRAYEQNLKALSQRADLQNPKEVELAIARYKRKKNNQPITNSYKTKLCDCYAAYCKYYKIEWEKPVYTPEPSSISPPTQETIQMLVASAKRELSLKLDISAQTGQDRTCDQESESRRNTNLQTCARALILLFQRPCTFIKYD